MKCPWITITKSYRSYYQTQHTGKPIEVTEQIFGECIKNECPFFGNRDQIKDTCLRVLRRG